jgi:hypothetical protein
VPALLIGIRVLFCDENYEPLIFDGDNETYTIDLFIGKSKKLMNKKEVNEQLK